MSKFDRKLRQSQHFVNTNAPTRGVVPQKPTQERMEPVVVVDPAWGYEHDPGKVLRTFALLGMIFKAQQEDAQHDS